MMHVSRTTSERHTPSLLLLRNLDAGDSVAICGTVGCSGSLLHLEILAVIGHNCQEGTLEDLLNALHLLAAALHVLCSHLLRNSQALLSGDRSEALRLEHVDACLLVTQVRLQAHQDERGVWAKVEHFGIPLGEELVSKA